MEPRYIKSGILYVDDESKSLKYFREIFEDLAPIYIAENAEEGERLFREHSNEIGLVLSDQRMPGISGLEFLKRIRAINDRANRILVTAYTDLNMAVDALNEDLLYSYLTKPWDPEELEGKLKRALDNFCLRAERDELLEDKAQAFQELMMAEKAATIGVLSSGLNHHMRNALTVIQPFFDMIPDQLQEEIGLGRNPNDTFFWKDYYQDVGQALRRITSLLSNLSEGAVRQIEPGRALTIQNDVDISSVIEVAAKEALGGDEGIKFTLRKEAGSSLIAVDTKKITRMAHLLIQEARMNIEGEGEIEVIISDSEGSSTQAKGVQITCIDSGLPIPESDRKRLFDPFYVRAEKPSEVGMNLMTCYLIIFQHGGTIRAEGLSDGRNAIILTLPATPAASNPNRALKHLFGDSFSRSGVSNKSEDIVLSS